VSARLAELNALTRADAERELLRCCGSRRWAAEMAGARPFSSEKSLFDAADRLWAGLAPSDWLEAFSHHPRIGQKPAERADLKSTQSWAREEQAGTQNAAAQTLAELRALNERYEKKFGHVYLVCATGKSADEMLALLKDRMNNDPEAELRVAAGEQSKITRLRLEKWLKP
jgi:OHCU decarboxylase